MSLTEMLKEERMNFVDLTNKARKMFKPKMKELRNKKMYKGLYLIGIGETPYEEMNFAIGTKKDYEKMLTKNEDKIMIGGII